MKRLEQADKINTHVFFCELFAKTSQTFRNINVLIEMNTGFKGTAEVDCRKAHSERIVLLSTVLRKRFSRIKINEL